MKRVLVVADEPDFAFTLQVGLENGSFIGAFTDPELTLCSSNLTRMNYSLLILCVVMDGFILYERLMTEDPGVTVCFLTAR